MLRTPLATLLLALTPALASAVAPGMTTGIQVDVGGVTRTYDLYVPAGWNGSTPLPLLLDFHPLGGSSGAEAGTSAFQPLAEAHQFLVAYPQGLGSWNAGFCCNPALANGVDDVGFARALVADVAARASVDPERVYATGLSNGAGMAHRLACEASDLFAAVAPVSVPLLYDPLTGCAPPRPMPVLHFACLNDPFVPYEGGLTGFSPTPAPSAQASFARWTTIGACVAPSTVELLPNGATCETYESCGGGVRVGLCSIHGSHFLYSNTDGVDVSQRVWEFVSGFTRSGAVTTTTTTTLGGGGSSTTTTTLPSVPCAAAPRTDCRVGTKTSLLVSEASPEAAKLKLAMGAFPVIVPSDFGNPVAGTTGYAVCLYDDGGALAGALHLERAGAACGTKPCWKAATGVFKYADAAGTASGIQAVTMKTGLAGAAKVALKAGNKAPALSLPTGIAPALFRGGAGASATVQIVTSDAGCLTTTASTLPKSVGTKYLAKTP